MEFDAFYGGVFDNTPSQQRLPAAKKDLSEDKILPKLLFSGLSNGVTFGRHVLVRSKNLGRRYAMLQHTVLSAV
jgi:hypothetical protein